MANRDNYRKQPGAMLVARGTAEVCRLIASDVLLGMPYAVEELDEGSDSSPSSPAKQKPRKRTAKRQPVEPEAPALDEPPAEEPPTDQPATEDDSGGEAS